MAEDPAGAHDVLTYEFDCNDNGFYETVPGTDTASCPFSDNGTFLVPVRVTDEDGGIALDSSQVIVDNVPPVAVFEAPATAEQGTALTLALADAGDRSYADELAGLEFAFDCGEGEGIGDFTSASSTSCPADVVGVRTVQGLVRDKDGGTTTYVAEVSVEGGAPEIAAVTNDGPVAEGDVATVTVVATHPSGSSEVLSYQFDCDSDGSYELGPQSNNTGGCTFEDDGTYQVNARVADADGDEDIGSTLVEVLNVAPTITSPGDQAADEGTPAALNLGGFADPGADSPWSVEIDWGDSTASEVFLLGSAGDLGSLPHAFADNGDYTVTVTVTEDGGAGEADADQFQVAVSNLDPAASSDVAEADEDGPSIEINVLANDSDPAGAADPLAITSLETEGTSGAPSFTASSVTYDPNGQFEHLAAGETATDSFGYTISDGDGGVDSATVTVTVHGQNDAPDVEVEHYSVTVGEGATAGNSGAFTDADLSDTVSISASVGRTTQDEGNSGNWAWELPTTDGPDESTTVSIMADDGNGVIASTAFDLVVTNVAPTVAPPADQAASEGTAVELDLGAFVDPGADSPWSVEVDWGDESDVTSFDVSSAGSLLAREHTYEDDGLYTVTVEVTDDDLETGSATLEVAVANVAPTAEFHSPADVNEGEFIHLSLLNRSDPSPVDEAAGLEFAFDCDDGAGFGAYASTAGTSCTTTNDGMRVVKGRIRDKDGGETEYSATVEVLNVAPTVNAAPNQTADEGTDAAFNLGSFMDPGEDSPWLVIVDWADGSPPNSFTVGTPGAVGSFAHTYADNGDYTVSVTVTEDAGTGAAGTSGFQVAIANLDPTANQDEADAFEDGPSIDIDVLANDTDPAGTQDPLSVTGVDTTETTGSVSYTSSGVTYDPDGQFGYLAAGETATDSFGYEIADGDGGSAGSTVLVTVSGQNDEPVVTVEELVVTVMEGETATNGGTFADIDSTDEIVVSASVGSVTQETSGSSGDWLWTNATTDGPADSQIVTITADDGHGGVHSANFELAVENVAPTVAGVTVPVAPVAIEEQSASTVEVQFSDPAEAYDEPYSCGFDMDSDGVTDVTVSTVTGTSCSAVPAYSESGVYRVTATVADKDGGSDSATAVEFLVVYDAAGGFVTGGGWIQSPPAAYIPDPTLTGKANFGFVSKYKKGANTPEGNTEFQFKAGSLNFHSSSYDWLVIPGQDKAKFKGVGKINGAGNYGFMITAIDGNAKQPITPDSFRIKIWDKDNADQLVYDNKLGTSDDSYDATELGGGNIKIHKP